MTEPGMWRGIVVIEVLMVIIAGPLALWASLASGNWAPLAGIGLALLLFPATILLANFVFSIPFVEDFLDR